MLHDIAHVFHSPVIEVCDATEAFCLTLSTESAAGVVQSFKACVLFGLDVYLDL